jgi:predicted PurR-regulated permease PerM
MIVFGIDSGLAAAVFGLIDWLAIPKDTRARRVGAWHGWGNLLMLGLFGASLLVRWPDTQSQSALAVLLSFVLAPVVDLLRRLLLGRVPAVLLAVLLALGAILFVGGLIGTQVAGLARDAPSYAATIERNGGVMEDIRNGKRRYWIDAIGVNGRHRSF